MICKNCGKEIEENSKFCNFCGTKIENETKDDVNHNSRYNLILKGYNGSKVTIIKAIRENLGLALADAKRLVDEVPTCIASNLTVSEYKLLEQKMKQVDAIVECEPIGENKNIDSHTMNCPCCEKKISVTANSCPNCGYVFNDLIKQESKQNSGNGIGFWGAVGAILVAFFIMMFL